MFFLSFCYDYQLVFSLGLTRQWNKNNPQMVETVSCKPSGECAAEFETWRCKELN